MVPDEALVDIQTRSSIGGQGVTRGGTGAVEATNSVGALIGTQETGGAVGLQCALVNIIA